MNQPLAPPTLVGLPREASAAGEIGIATVALWTLAAIALAALIIFVLRWISSRRSRSAASSAVLVSMCNGLRMTRADRKLLKQLAEESNGTSPVSLLLCPSVFERAAVKAAAKVDQKALHRLRQKLAA